MWSKKIGRKKQIEKRWWGALLLAFCSLLFFGLNAMIGILIIVIAIVVRLNVWLSPLLLVGIAVKLFGGNDDVTWGEVGVAVLGLIASMLLLFLFIHLWEKYEEKVTQTLFVISALCFPPVFIFYWWYVRRPNESMREISNEILGNLDSTTQIDYPKVKQALMAKYKRPNALLVNAAHKIYNAHNKDEPTKLSKVDFRDAYGFRDLLNKFMDDRWDTIMLIVSAIFVILFVTNPQNTALGTLMGFYW